MASAVRQMSAPAIKVIQKQVRTVAPQFVKTVVRTVPVVNQTYVPVTMGTGK